MTQHMAHEPAVSGQLEELQKRLAELHDLDKVSELLGWDQQTMMAPRGGDARAEQLSTLARITMEKFTDPAIGELLEALRDEEARLPYDADEASLIRVGRRDYEKAVRVPPSLSAEIVRAGVLGRQAWAEARDQSDFSLFLPHLKRNVELKHQYIACLNDGGPAYDVLLDDYEPEMKTVQVQACFEELKPALVSLIDAIRAKQDTVNDTYLHGHFPAEIQKQFAWQLIEQLGASSESWRLDPTVHPFATSISTQDIRITTRYYEEFLSPSLFGSMHEFGHGLYEHQIGAALEHTPLCGGASYALHESQSRTWENLVGRSRSFWQYMYPQLQDAYPTELGDVPLESFYRAINKVQPSYIRVEADEATYCLHIILRFELEQEILRGDIPLEELPAAWNERFKQYFGLDVPNDAQGVLQDVHWSAGAMGYFPTYALGSIIASQLWEKAQADIPDLDDCLADGEFGVLRTWQQERLHRHGRKFTPVETLQQAGLHQIEVGPYMAYLEQKFGEIYDL